MSIDYMMPRHVQELYDVVLLRTIAEYRQAVSILEGSPSVRANQLKGAMGEALDVLEQELRRRMRVSFRPSIMPPHPN